MKTLCPPPSFRCRRAQSRGVALVLTLAFLVLLSVFLLAFFSNVQTDMQSSQSYASGISVKQLADTATNVVMGQIADGTSGYEVPGHSSAGSVSGQGRRLAWVSQPGLIRTYDDAGVPGRSFKLYSSDNMVTAAGDEFNAKAAQAAEVPEDWPGKPALFTDLNRPVNASETDPETGEVSIVPNYPILDPGALNKVEGFDIENAPGADAANAAPMPVRWIYVLADGALATPSGGDRVATFAGRATAAMPTKENPIVGRVAFWTDDETCKLNINTASEGVFWDRPWAEGPTERALSNLIPRQNEFNRYNGHPAVTSLSPVFGSLFPVTATGFDPTASPLSTQLSYYLGQGVTGKPQGTGLAPRVNLSTDRDAASAVKFKYERLYASVDELLFTPVVTGQERGRFNTGIDREFLERAKFFLTTSNRSPELTLSGKPRVSLWPIQQRTDERNAKDKLITFCTTVGAGTANESPYYFQRATKYTGDGRTQFSSPTPSSQHPSSDWAIARNQQIFSYLQTLTGTSIPGFGNDFKTKWGVDRDQVLAESLDYIRSSINGYSTALSPLYDYLPSRSPYPMPGETQAIPLTFTSAGPAQIPDPCMGFGRTMTITEAALVFVRVGTGAAASDQLQAYLILEPFNPSPGPPSWSPNLRIVVEGLENFSLTTRTGAGVEATRNLGFRADARNLINSRVGYSGGGHKESFMGLQAFFRTFDADRTDKDKTLPPATGTVNEVTQYPFVSLPIVFPAADSAAKARFNGGDITIKLYSGYEVVSATQQPQLLVQTLRMNFPDIAYENFPMPLRDTAYPTTASRFVTPVSGSIVDQLIRPNDTVRSVEASATGATRGDLRIQAGLKVVDASFFAPHPKYHTTERLAHGLRTNGPAFLNTGTTHAVETRLLSGYNYETYTEPAAARGTARAIMKGGILGDWDTGSGNIYDGAYINKADEGNLDTSGAGNAAYYSRGTYVTESGASYSPNRQIASAVNFGSLPTGIKRTRDAQIAGNAAEGQPWQTLLFCRNPAAGEQHPGRAVAPRDHLYLDLFAMPIVEPYAISEPFSTAGKVNLNYQIVPFTYIKRDTAMRGVLKPVKLTAFAKADIASYKKAGNTAEYRRDINLDETLRGFEQRFDTPANASAPGDKGAFRSPSEICDMWLVPQKKGTETQAKPENMASWWSSLGPLTGDNVREAPYGQIYPRVTTRSNTFTIHMRVQSLRKSAATPATEWNESRDQVLGEYRGSTTIERYVDPGDPRIPDFATNPEATMDSFYRFRVIETKRFAP